jgi:hypothetical protein
MNTIKVQRSQLHSNVTGKTLSAEASTLGIPAGVQFPDIIVVEDGDNSKAYGPNKTWQCDADNDIMSVTYMANDLRVIQQAKLVIFND